MDMIIIMSLFFAFLALIAVTIRLCYLKIMHKDIVKTKNLLNNVAIIFAILFVLSIIVSITESKSTVDHTNEQTSDQITDTAVIFDADEYAKITVEHLKQKMGEPTSMKDAEGEQGAESNQIYSYDKDSLHYEFILSQQAVKEVTIYSAKAWTKKGAPFTYSDDDKKDILKSFHVENSNKNLIAHNKNIFQVTDVSDKVDVFEVNDLNEKDKTYGSVKISYQSNYKPPKELSSSETFSVIITIVLMIFIIGLGGYGIVRIIEKNRNARRAQNQMIQDLKAKGMNQIAYFTMVRGLPLPNNTACRLTTWNDRIEIEANNTKFTLMKDKLIDASLKNEVEVDSHYETINNQLREKRKRYVYWYLIITYSNANGVNYIKFNVSDKTRQASKIIDEIRSGIQYKKKVDL